MTNRRQLVDAVEVTDTGIHIVRLKKIFDATSVSEFEKVLAYLLERKQYKIVVDLTNVEFVASAGWGAFTAEFRNVRTAGGDIRLAGMNPDVQDVFFLLELDSFINAYNHVDEAIVSFEAESPKMDSAKAAGAAPRPGAKKAQAYEPKSSEASKPEREEISREQEEAEPAAFEVAEIYDPDHRKPIALGTGDAPPTPAYETQDDSSDAEEDGWVISEEIQTESEDFEAFEADENFSRPALLPGATATRQSAERGADTDERSAEFAHFAQELSRHSHGDSEPAEGKPIPLPARVSNEPRTVRPATEWPEARAEENETLEDFELQDIHDPWILEEIDTLPEEDDFETTQWNEGEFASEEPVVSPQREERKQITAPQPQAPYPVVMRKQNSGVVAKASTTAVSADKFETAPPRIQKTQPAARVHLEGDHVEMVKRIVSDHPHYGPAMIQKFFETRMEPPMAVSRSTIYRWLKLAGLNTREQRLEFAGKAGA